MIALPVARPPAANSFLRAVRQKWGVMHAVMLRDMRTRFFNHGLGFILVILWPLAHMGALLFIYMLFGRRAPYGDNLYLFFATGLVPTLSFMYVSRFMALSLNMNYPMLALPAVRPSDILFGRALLEILGACSMAILTFGLLLVLGANPIPGDPVAAVSALAVTLVLAVGMGMIVGVLAQLLPFLLTIYLLVTILFYILSGTLFVVAGMPTPIAEALAWNPVLHGTEWMRTAYYPGYPTQILDIPYMIAWAVGLLFLGLLMERLLRPWVLEHR